MLPDLKLFCKTKAIKTAWNWQKKKKKNTTTNRHIDLSNNTESQGIYPHTYGQLIYNKGDKNKTQWRNNSLFNTWCWESWPATYKTMELEHFLTLHAKINIKRLNYVLDIML